MSHRTVRAFFILVIVLAQIFTGITPARAAPPANDDFANAEEIASLPFSASVNNTQATLEPGEPHAEGCGQPFRTLWYSFMPAEDLAIRITIPSSGNVKLFLASGPAISDLIFQTCANGGDSASFALQAGQTYYLQVDSYGQGTTIQFSLEQVAAVANDNFADATPINALPFSTSADITNASAEYGEPVQCGHPFRSVWYAFTPAEDMAVRVDMFDSQVAGTVGVYLASGPALSDLTFFACASTGRSTNFALEAGKTYFLRVDIYGDPGVLQVNLQQITPPANDNFADAANISSLPFNDSVDNTNATVEIGELNVCDADFGSVWYSFTPSTDMTVRVGLTSDQVYGGLGIFLASGSTRSDLTLLTCTFGVPRNLHVEGGQTYYLQADSSQQPGVLQVSLEEITPPTNDNFADATAIGSLPFTASVDNTNATVEAGESQRCGDRFRSVWYSFTPAEDMALRLDRIGSQVGGFVEVYLGSGTSISDLTFLACAFNNPTNLHVEGGQTYYLRVDSYDPEPGVLQVNVQQITPPANDNFADATLITSLPFNDSVDNTNATAEFREPGHCSDQVRTVWYSFTPAEDMVLRLDVSGSQVEGAADIFFASGPDMSDLTFMGCTYSDLASNFKVEAGKTYYLHVDSFNQPGVLQINAQQIVPPSNDDFADATPFNALPFSASVNNTNATFEPGEVGECEYRFRSIWYAFTPAEDMAVRLDMFGGSHIQAAADIYLASGPALSDLTFFACATSGGPVNFAVEAGQTYYLRVDSSFQTGDLQINLQQITAPANDNFAHATAISSLPFSDSVDNTNATLEFDEPGNCGYPFGTIWYSFTPTEDMFLGLDISDSPAGNQVANIYVASGPGISDLTFMTCTYFTNNSANFKVEGGKTYYIQLDTYGEPPGVLRLNLRQLSPPENDDFANAEAIASLPSYITVDNTDATIEPGEDSVCGSAFRSVWYTFTPTESMAVRAGIAGVGTYALLTIFAGSGTELSALTFVDCVANGSKIVELEAGQTYYLRLDSANGPGLLQLSLAEPNPPVNDNFASPESIGSVPFTTRVDVTDATAQPNEPQFCNFMSHTVWYAFAPAETITVRADTLGSSVGSNVNIYKSSGTSFSDLEFLDCSGPYNAPSFLAEAGQTYYLQAGSIYDWEQGTIQINLEQTFPPPNDNVANPVAVTDLPFIATVDTTDATKEQNEPQNCTFMPNTIWYSFTPTETTKVRADTQGSQVSGNVNIYHATGNGFADLQLMQCSYYQGVAAFLAEAGEMYFFQVGSLYGQAGPIQFNLAEMPTISGRVTDAVTGAPIPGNAPPYANVTLLINCGEGCFTYANSQYADGEGRFAFDSFYYGSPLSAGTYLLEVHADLYPTKQFGPFEFSGNKVDLGDVPLSPSAKIRGRAVDAETGNPLAGTYVNLSRCSVGGCFEYVNSQYTDGNGQFQFNSYSFGAPLPGGTYELTFSDNLHETKRLEISVGAGEDHNVGDVALTPFPLVGSISGKIVDFVTGQPVSQTFIPSLALYRCTNGICNQWVGSQDPDSLGRFHFTTDYNGNPIPVGTFQIQAGADQYQFYVGDPFTVGEAENKNVGNVRLTSYPVRFSEMQACSEISATGGDCVYSIKITNGQPIKLEGQAWSLVSSYLPDSFAHYTLFRAGDNQGLSLAPGKSKVLQFRFTVPANPSPYGSSVCTQIFIGQGNNPLLTTIGFRNLFCVTRSPNGFTITSPDDLVPTPQTASTASTGSELEPNNSCQAAQDLTAAQYPLVLSGELDSSQSPDVDFYRFTGTPGSLTTIDLEGQGTGKGTLSDPFLGFFDSNCNLIAINDDSGGYLNSRLEITVPSDGVFVMAATRCCDYGFFGGGYGSYQMTIAPVQTIGSIRGVVTDAVTGTPLRGDAAPFASVRLFQCTQFGCSEVNSQLAGADGRFNFSSDYSGGPLRVGSYFVVVNADQYQFYQSQNFSVGEAENYDLGNVPLTSFPVRFSDVQPCAVPTDGAVCEFTVKITNGLATRLTGQAWSIINGYGIGTFTNYTLFQTDAPLDVSLDRGKSKVLTFRFRVRGTVPDGAYMCASVSVGQNPNPLFNTVGQYSLFCFVKGSSGLTLMSQQEMHQKLLHEKLNDVEPKKGPSMKK
jgi:hypothetical protein